jgi:pimeloyl-ACP methyl ester carboxylesterase
MLKRLICAAMLAQVACTSGASAAAASGQYMNVGLHRLYYEIHGNGPPVVLLHGGGSNIRDSFSFQVDFLAAHHRVIAIEQRGQGHSPDAPGPLTYASMLDDTATLLKQLHVANADIVGFSDGAILGLMLGIRYPELVRKIVASGANLDPYGLTDRSFQETMNAGADATLSGRDRVAYGSVSPQGAGHLTVIREKLRQLWLTHPTPDEISPAMLQKLRRPVLVISGDHDEVRLEHTLLIFRSVPNAKLWILPGTGHPTFGLRPEWINPVLQSFLDEK